MARQVPIAALSLGILLFVSARSDASVVFDAPSYPLFKPPNSGTVTAADLDADGRTDIVTGSGGIHWLRSLGDDAFAPAVELWSGSVYATAATDLDLDGRLDIVSVSMTAPELVVIYGLGGGAFEPAVQVALPSDPGASRIMALDIDGNPLPELFVPLRNTDRIAILPSAGPRAWNAAVIIPTIRLVTTLELVDWNLDGRLDLVAGSSEADSLALHLGSPGLAFDPPLFLARPDAGQLRAGPIDGLPGDDLLVFGIPAAEVRSNAGDGSFAAAQSITGLVAEHGVLIDLDGDGDRDVVGAYSDILPPARSSVTAALSNGDGSFGTVTTYTAYSTPNGIDAADFDGDGKADVAVSSSFLRPVALLRGNGDGTFGTPYHGAARRPLDVAVGDVTGDGFPDAVVADFDSGGVFLLAGLGNGGLATCTRIASLTEARAVRLGDVDGDGDVDIVAGGAGVLLTIPVLPGGSFGAPLSVAAPNPVTDLALAHLNGDAWLDAVTISTSGPEARVHVGSVGGFLAGQSIALAGTPRKLALGRVDAGPTIDLVATVGSTVVFYAGGGAGAFVTPGITVATPTTATGVAIDDFDTDGFSDLAVGFSDGTSSGVLRLESDGASGFAPTGPWPTSLDPLATAATSELVTADFDGDGDRDIFALAFQRYSALLLNAGDGTFAQRQGFGTILPGTGVAVGDLDGDTGPDLVVTGTQTSGNGVHHSVAVLHNRVAALADVPPSAGSPARGLRLALAPNPATSATRVMFTAPQSADASIDVYSVTGRREATRPLGAVAAGRRSEAIPGPASLRPGLYWARVTVGTSVEAIRFAITR